MVILYIQQKYSVRSFFVYVVIVLINVYQGNKLELCLKYLHKRNFFSFFVGIIGDMLLINSMTSITKMLHI